MISISSRVQYACLAVLALAKRRGSARPTKIEQIASEQNIPKQFLVHILLQLKRDGILGSTRGVGGGYYMSKDPSEVTVGDIVRAVEPTLSSPQTRSSGRRGSGESNEVLFALWKEVEKQAVSAIDRVTIDELTDRISGSPEYVI